MPATPKADKKDIAKDADGCDYHGMIFADALGEHKCVLGTNGYNQGRRLCQAPGKTELPSLSKSFHLFRSPYNRVAENIEKNIPGYILSKINCFNYS